MKCWESVTIKKHYEMRTFTLLPPDGRCVTLQFTPVNPSVQRELWLDGLLAYTRGYSVGHFLSD